MTNQKELSSQELTKHLSGMLQYPTISYPEPENIDHQAFSELHNYLERTFPSVFANLEKEIINTHSLLLTWRGTHKDLDPILLMGHIDVVPIEPGTETKWNYPPFSGKIEDGFIWGRGALDDKQSVAGILEAIESLLLIKYQPRRTILIAIGHDEELGGVNGQAQIARILKERGVHLELVLDEGLAVTVGILPIDKPIALIGAAEKGYVSLELIVEIEGGHSSMPGENTSIGILSKAILSLMNHPFPPHLGNITSELFRRIAPEMPTINRFIFKNQKIFRSLILNQLAKNPSTNANIRTTIAPTIFQAGTKDNVLPSKARAIINFRLIPGDTKESVLKYVRRIIVDERVELQIKDEFAMNPSPVSDIDSRSFKLLEESIHSTFPGVLVVPGLVLGATDCRHYTQLSNNCYRFSPIRVTKEDMSRIHGTNERISVENYTQVVSFYRRVLHEGSS